MSPEAIPGSFLFAPDDRILSEIARREANILLTFVTTAALGSDPDQSRPAI